MVFIDIKLENRRKRIKLWVSDEERALIEEKAKSYGYKTIASYIRDSAIYEKVTYVDFKHRQDLYDAYSQDTKVLKGILKEFRHFSKYATQLSKDDLQHLSNLLLEIMKNQKAMINLIDKKLDLDVWQEINNKGW